MECTRTFIIQSGVYPNIYISEWSVPEHIYFRVECTQTAWDKPNQTCAMVIMLPALLRPVHPAYKTQDLLTASDLEKPTDAIVSQQFGCIEDRNCILPETDLSKTCNTAERRQDSLAHRGYIRAISVSVYCFDRWIASDDLTMNIWSCIFFIKTTSLLIYFCHL